MDGAALDSLSQWFSTRGDLSPQGTNPQFEMFLVAHTVGSGDATGIERVWRSGMQLNTPQCIGWPPRQRTTQPNVRGAGCQGGDICSKFTQGWN